MADRQLVVRIIGDDKDLRRAFASSERSAQTFQGRIQGVGIATSRSFLAAGVAAGATAVSFQAVTRGIAESVSRASNLSEQISKSRQVFGQFSAEIEAWSRTTARSFGIAQDEAIGFTGSLGNMFTAMGVGQGQAAKMSVRMVELAADMASFNNEDPSAMLERLRSGLAGEMEPLRRFGSVLSASRVETFAWANGIADAGEKLTEQQKILARYGLVLQDTKVQQGNFALTSGELANQTRILRAQMNDFAANLGSVLIPVLTDATAAANALFAALEQMRGKDFTPGFDFPDVPGWLKTGVGGLGAGALAGGPAVVLAGAGIKKLLDEQNKADKEALDAIDRGLGDERGTPEGRLAEQARQRAEAARNATRDLARSQKAFAEFAKGLGLKLDRAGLTESLADDIAVLRELERAILRQIEREGRTFKLVDQLTQVRLQISGLAAVNAQDAADAVRNAFSEVMDSLSLQLEVALATKSFSDDQAALRKIEQAILARIEDEGRTTELLRRLFDVRQEQAEIRRRMAEQARAQRESNQFEALGLTGEGEARVPGAGALRRRTARLEDQIKGTALDTPKTRQQLENIGNVLAGEYGKLGRKVRQAILDMLNEITNALKEGTEEQERNVTAHRITDPNKILEGLGLSEAQIREMRARLISQSSGGGFRTAPGQGAFGFSTFGAGDMSTFSGFQHGMGGAIVVTGPITVVSDDPDEMGRKLGKKARRAVKSRGGRFAGNRGL